MAPERETMMMLKVDLDCARCYKKVKNLLCSIPQVTDQIYDKNQKNVQIKVVGYCPERIRDKICCKGGKTIKDIQIMDPPKKPSSESSQSSGSEKKPETTPELAKSPTLEQKEKKPKEDETPPPPPPPRNTCCSDCYEGRTTGPCYTGCGYGYGYGYGYGVPPRPPPGWWGYYGGCSPGGYYYINYENPPACVIM